MFLRKATNEDFPSVLAFYEDVIERTPGIGIHARWSKGKHPTPDGLRTFIGEGCMYLYEEGDVIVGAVHDFTCPQTGKNYMLFPIRRL